MLNNIVRNMYLISCAMLVSGCAMPLPFQVASWAIDGISYIATEKSVTDHGISYVAQKDCALLRVIQGQEICSSLNDSKTLVVSNANTETAVYEIKEKEFRQGQAISELVVLTETNAPLPKASRVKHQLEKTESALSTRQLIPGKSVWSNQLDAGMYYVVGSFSNRGYAQSMINKHIDLGPAVLVSNVNGDKVFRVAVGPFSTLQKRDVQLSMKKSGIIDAWALHIDHEEWRLASPKEFFKKENSINQTSDSIKTWIKNKPKRSQKFVGEFGKVPISENKFGIKRRPLSRYLKPNNAWFL